ncbi:glycoside hydrolase family 53 protein [Echinicola salinicaeni]|uniref:glycoside hydrolase family 53 protein n=1 Tax=Echinicola salinicaeni TaxID=2762757 RepID=UPI001645A194|nr:glycosyl hydrolase 53 family protein [Echinicola salinicaeni]
MNRNNVTILNLFTLVILAVSCFSCQKEIDYRIGADISFLPQMEARGATYLNKIGEQEDPIELLANHHFNTVRLRLFVDPTAEKGYSKEGFCGLDRTLEMAKRIKKAGMEFVLDFHYSDYWADPDKQFKPSAWEGATGKPLQDSLYQYTHKVLTTFKEAGVAPDVIQIGNEINHGMVWPEGKVMDNATDQDWESLMGLYTSGQKAVREVLPNAKIMVHLALGGQNKLCREFLDKMKDYGAVYDIIGLSYYEQWHGTYNDLKANLYDLANTYKKPIAVCEYGANLDNVKRINDIVRSIPNGLGYGTMAWEPLRALFDQEGKPAGELFAVYDNIYDQYTDPEKSPVVEQPQARTVKAQRPVIGADISFVPQMESRGVSYSDQGKEKDVVEILKDHRFNWIRLRLFVDPTSENGYSKEGYCGLEETLEMAKRVKASGMKFLLDFHYSDTWADPGKQFMPAAWEELEGSALERKIYNYTKGVVERFIDEGVAPEMVQIGNEIHNGMLWPVGKIEGDQAESFCVLLRCASAAVRSVDPNIDIMVHIAKAHDLKNSIKFFDKIISRDVVFDIIGQSYYPEWHGELDNMEANLTELANRYEKPIIVVEYKEYKKEVNEIVKNLPNGLGLGTFIWEATSPGWGDLFDRNGAANENIEIYPAFYEGYGK